MKKTICLLFLAFSFFAAMAQKNNRFIEEGEEPVTTEQQENEAPPPQPSKNTSNKKDRLLDKLRFGGNFGATFGSITYLNISPRIYYTASEKLWIGVGGTYIYTQYKAPYIPLETNVYGANISATYMVYGPFFAQAEYEPLSYEPVYYNGDKDARLWQHSVFLGGGFRQELGRGAVFISVMYNLTYTNEFSNYYSQPYVVRIGFGI